MNPFVFHIEHVHAVWQNEDAVQDPLPHFPDSYTAKCLKQYGPLRFAASVIQQPRCSGPEEISVRLIVEVERQVEGFDSHAHDKVDELLRVTAGVVGAKELGIVVGVHFQLDRPLPEINFVGAVTLADMIA